MDGLLKFADFFDRPVRKAGQFAGWIMLPLIMVIMFDVITRKIDFIRIWMAELNLRWFNPIIFQDAEWHLHGIILFLSFGFGYLMNAHVRVDIFREMLPRRKQAWTEVCGLVILGIPYLIIISIFAYRFVALSWGQGEGSESLTGIGMRYIIKTSMPIGFLLLLTSFLVTLARLLAFLFGNEEQQQRAYDGLEIFADHNELEEVRKKLEAEAAAAAAALVAKEKAEAEAEKDN